MLIEFLDDSDFMLAWVLDAKSHRVTALSMAGREITVSQNRILVSQTMPDPGDKQGRVKLMREAAERRAALARQVDMKELWDILEGEGDSFGYETLAELVYAQKPETDQLSAVYRAVYHNGLCFKFSPEAALRQSQEEIDKLTEAREKAERKEAYLNCGAMWLKDAVAGRPAEEPAEGETFKRRLIDLAVLDSDAPQRQEVQEMLKRAGLSPDAAGAHKALVALGEFGIHENIDLRRLDLGHDFSPEEYEAAGSLTLDSWPDEDRLDLTNKEIITIDSWGAKDFDDALSLETTGDGHWLLGLHITDAAGLIPMESILDKAAQNRVSSIYLPEARYPMLPEQLSEGLLSLRQDEFHKAFSFMVTIGKDGQIISYKVAPSLLTVTRQMSFNDADQVLADDPTLSELHCLAKALLARREANGAVELNLPKCNIYFTSEGRLAHSVTSWDTPARLVVSELMVLANYLAADALQKAGYPCPYRFQEKAGQGKETQMVEGLAPEKMALVQALAQRRRTGRSGLGFAPGPHNGLGLPVYTAFTAPMRRYMDMLVARQLRALSRGEPPVYDEQEFMRLALPAHDMQIQIQKLQNRRHRYWLAVMLAEKMGQTFTGVVFDRHDRKLLVCITEYMLETDIFIPKSVDASGPWVGRDITLRLVTASPRDDVIKFEWAQEA